MICVLAEAIANTRSVMAYNGYPKVKLKLITKKDYAIMGQLRFLTP